MNHEAMVASIGALSDTQCDRIVAAWDRARQTEAYYVGRDVLVAAGAVATDEDSIYQQATMAAAIRNRRYLRDRGLGSADRALVSGCRWGVLAEEHREALTEEQFAARHDGWAARETGRETARFRPRRGHFQSSPGSPR